MDLLQREHNEISTETGIRQMTCYVLHINSHSNLILNTICFVLVKFVWLANIKPKRIASASRGFLAAARLSCLLTYVLDNKEEA